LREIRTAGSVRGGVLLLGRTTRLLDNHGIAACLWTCRRGRQLFIRQLAISVNL